MTLTGLLFMLAFVMTLGLAFVRHPIYGLYAYIAVFYLHPPSRWWGETLPDLRWSLLAAAVTLLATWIKNPPDGDRRAWYATAPAKFWIVFVIWFWIGGLWALDKELHWPAAVLLTKYLLVFYMVYRLAVTPDQIRNVLVLHVAGCLYLGYLGYAANFDGRLDGVGGPGIDDSNTLGMQLATGIIVGGVLALEFRKWGLLFCVVAIAFALNTVILTGSRGAFLAFVGGGLMVAYLRPRAYERRFKLFALLAVVLLGTLASQNFWERMNTVTAVVDETQELEGSAASRIAMFKAQIRMAEAYPQGAGHRGSEVLSPRYLDPQYLTHAGYRSSHNVMMTIAVEQGVPGLFMFFASIFWVWSVLRKMKSRLAETNNARLGGYIAAIGGALAVVLVGGLFADFAKCEIQIWMLALLASVIEFDKAGREARSIAAAPARRVSMAAMATR